MNGVMSGGVHEQAAQPVIDPVCAFHGKRWSEHEHGRCLYCCLCFKTLTWDECHVTVDGDREDVCNDCAANEYMAEVSA